MEIKQVKSDEVHKIVEMAKQYTDNIPHLNYNEEHSIKSIKEFLDNDIGVMFLLFDNDIVKGGICGIKYPCILTGELVAVELFWYTDRNTPKFGVQLLDLFEQWAKDSHCKRVAMIYLPCSMPKQLHTFYENRGYLLREMHFEKEI
jgi:hypothetical protein